MIGISAETKKTGNVDDEQYRSFLERFEQDVLGTSAGALFMTDAVGLWDAYLASFPDDERQFHNCNACRHFVERYGGLVTISEDGIPMTALWHHSPSVSEYRPAFDNLRSIVRRAKVTGVLLTKDPVLGHAITGVWRHFSLRAPVACKARPGILTPFQQMAEKREDQANVMRALVEFPSAVVDQALTILKSDALYRSEKVLGQAEWLHALHVAWDAAKGDRRSNVVWRAVAAAPAGFCHPRASMIGTLLEDIAAGLPFEDVSRKFRAKMAPNVYQRPQAAPSAGTIAQAEKLVAELGIARSLERRFARLDEISTLWKPETVAAPEPGGVFGHLQQKGTESASALVVSAQKITWEKFARAVLPDAKGIEFHVPYSGAFCALTTAVHAGAPPILQWDQEERRNPVSHYLYVNGSPAANWGLSTGLCEVTAIALKPWQWFGAKCEHQGSAALFILKGARDSRTGQGNALFPETMRSDLHGVRAVIESYARTAALGGREESDACGYMMNTGSPVTVRVRAKNGTRLDYTIDRWD